jgi:hypothetical protein
MQEHFRLVDGVSEVKASSVFNNAAQKMIKDGLNTSATYCCHMLHTCVEAADETRVGERDLSDQGLTPSGDGRLVG